MTRLMVLIVADLQLTKAMAPDSSGRSGVPGFVIMGIWLFPRPFSRDH